MNMPGGIPGPLALIDGEDALVVRPDAQVEVRLLPPGATEFIVALADNQTVLQASELAAAFDGSFNLTANIAGLIEAGAFIGYERDDGNFARGTA
jgi:hypothetical protein